MAPSRRRSSGLRQSPRIEYASIRRLKERWLRRSFDRFLRLEVSRGSPRAARFDAFVAAQAWWLDEYALFRSLHARHDELPWTQWPEPLARADAAAVAKRAASLRLEITYRSYLQWLAAEQWAEAKRLSWPVRVFGDLPFMISADSPDVWARQHEFRFDATIGVPPDAFSETGQDWGLPPWRADVMAANGLRLDARPRAPLRRSLRRLSASITSSACIACTSGRSTRRIAAFFDPADEPSQIALGETLVGILCRRRSRSPTVIAEDLGSIPPFVRESMARLDLPGLKVLRWERHWDRDGQPPIDPRGIPGAIGGHDRHARHRAAGGDAGRGRPKNSAPRSCSRCCPRARA